MYPPEDLNPPTFFYTSPGLVDINLYSLVWRGNLSWNGTSAEPTFINPHPASTLVIYDICRSEIFSSSASLILSVPAWLSMTINSLLASIVRVVWLWSISSTFCVMPVQKAPYFLTRFHKVNRKFALYSCWNNKYISSIKI